MRARGILCCALASLALHAVLLARSLLAPVFACLPWRRNGRLCCAALTPRARVARPAVAVDLQGAQQEWPVAVPGDTAREPSQKPRRGVLRFPLQLPEPPPGLLHEGVYEAVAEAIGEAPQPRFSDLDLHELTHEAIREELGYEFMTPVQAKSLPHTLAGDDVLVKAQTGSGKTLAFMVPIVDALGREETTGAYSQRYGALILSPSRELAMQTFSVAQDLASIHGLTCLCIYGDNPRHEEQLKLNEVPDIIVATPGRFLEHTQTTLGVQQKLRYLRFVVLDEADNLFGSFSQTLTDILEMLPVQRTAQTMLFSATFPESVSYLAGEALKLNYLHIDVAGGEVSPSAVNQTYLPCATEDSVGALWRVIRHEQVQAQAAGHPAKILVFFTTARVTQYFADVFRDLGMRVWDIHSKIAQAARTEAAGLFWTAEDGILFSTDVSARGMDYPNVSTVIHFGAPITRFKYIHRLGRTGRMGAGGRSILLLHDFEDRFLQEVADLLPRSSVFRDPIDTVRPPPVPRPRNWARVGQAYIGWLAYYFKHAGLMWGGDEALEQAARFAASINGLDEDGKPPVIRRLQVKKIGLPKAQVTRAPRRKASQVDREPPKPKKRFVPFGVDL